MAKYRHKPYEIEAEQFWPNKKPWPEGVYEQSKIGGFYFFRSEEYGVVSVKPGDWIVTTADAFHYMIGQKSFAENYEMVVDEKADTAVQQETGDEDDTT